MQAPELPLAPVRAGRGWRGLAVDLYLTLRISTLGFTGLLPLVGAAAVAPGFDAARTGWLLAVALAFHGFAYMLNDVVDLWVDRTEPLRVDSPLVRGALQPRVAAAIAWAQVPLAFGLALAGGFDESTLAWLALAFAAMTLYDVYGKRCPWPLLTDAVQSVGWCALLMLGAQVADADGRGAAASVAATGWLAGYVFLCVMLVNGVHGALRDLANDHRRGARTTAAWFGARAGDGTAVTVPRSLAAYALALQAGLVVCAAMAGWRLDHGSAAGQVATAALVVGTLAAAAISLAVAFGRAGDRRALVAAGAGNIVATLAVLPALVAVRLGGAGAAVLLAVFVLPLLAMWAYNGTQWGLAGDDPPAPPPAR